VWEEYGKRQGTLIGKQANDLVYESPSSRHPPSLPILLTLELSQTVVEGWVTLQVAYRSHLGISVDSKAAQNEGE
jgi:hypothetical protein